MLPDRFKHVQLDFAAHSEQTATQLLGHEETQLPGNCQSYIAQWLLSFLYFSLWSVCFVKVARRVDAATDLAFVH